VRKRRFGSNSSVIAPEGEVGIGDGKDEVLGHFAASEHGAHGLADLGRALERLACAPDAVLDAL
jgi:hypothetical protein